MREKIEARLATLRSEFETGRAVLVELDQKRASLDQTLLRISGAIQVCEELLTQPAAAAEGVDNGNNS